MGRLREQVPKVRAGPGFAWYVLVAVFVLGLAVFLTDTLMRLL